jgi:hypothetical protein
MGVIPYYLKAIFTKTTVGSVAKAAVHKLVYANRGGSRRGLPCCYSKGRCYTWVGVVQKSSKVRYAIYGCPQICCNHVITVLKAVTSNSWCLAS